MKIAPFAAVAGLAEGSLLLPPGVASPGAAYASVVLLALTALSCLLPWGRLPRRAAVAVPLLYCGTALALTLATRPDSGMGTVVLLPVIWTALFHDRWDSACMVVAVLLVELTVALAQHATDATTFRRLAVWTVLAAVISVASHALRDRARHAHRQVEALKDQLQAVRLADERLRIALALQDDVVNQIFASTLALRLAQADGHDEGTNLRIDDVVSELDDTVRRLRRAVFDSDGGPAQVPAQAPAPGREPDRAPAPGRGPDRAPAPPPGRGPGGP
ncbi:MAG TPA: hypothetical protein VFN68_03105 [Acidimicrobiales bacterium]|nr:hypothetical protein [Acidimicrobiales bacterium]